MSASTFQFDRDFQIGILSLMAQNWEFLITAVDLIQPQYFEDRTLVWTFTAIRDYFQDHNTRIDQIVIDNELRKANLSGRVKDEELDAHREVITRLHSPVNAQQYLVSEVVRFCRRQEVRKAMLEFAPKLESDDDNIWDEIVARMMKSCTVGSHTTDRGTNYFAQFKDRLKARMAEEEQLIIPTGISELDHKIGGGLHAGQLGIWMGGTGVGKCLKIGTQVLRYDGRLVPVESVVVGDELMGPDSRPRRVLSTVSGVDDLYRVIPTKGDSWVCTADHILTLVHTSRGLTIDVSLPEYLAKCKKFKHCYKQFSVGVEFPRSESLPLDPYFLGVWFGDGTKSLGNAKTPLPGVSITSMDPEIRQCIETIASQFNMSVRVENTSNKGKASTFYIIGKSWIGEGHKAHGGSGRWSNILLDLLRSIVGPGANIPQQYLTSSHADRAAFLAGFIDTDGSLQHNCYEITQKRRDYADVVCFVARSLGMRATCAQKFIDGVVYWRCVLSGNVDVIPVRIARKRAMPRRQIKDARRTGIVVMPDGRGEYAGFTLDGDGRFLLSDFTVTHNSIALPHCGKAAVSRQKNVVHYTLELNESDICIRYDSAWTAVPVHELKTMNDKVEQHLGKLFGRYGNCLIIKDYPTGQATVSMMKAHLQSLRGIGFIPDLVVVDYGDLMKPSNSYQNVYEDLGVIFTDLRGLAGELKIPIWTACLTGDTLIETPNGQIPIEQLVGKIDHPIYCIDKETKQIVVSKINACWLSNPATPIWKVTLDNGEVVRGTPTHPFMLRDGTYCKLSDLQPGYSLMPFVCHQVRKCKVVSVEQCGFDAAVYNLEVDVYHNYALAAGVIVKNTQVNRGGYSQEVADVDSIGDSYKKAQIADVVIAICATKEEMEMDALRLFIAKNRNGPSKHTIKIRSAYDRMCFWNPVGAPLGAIPPSAGPSVAPPPGLPKTTMRKPRNTV